jgi:hypothetical protein
MTMTVLLWAVMGCANQTTVRVEHKITTPDGVITETNFYGEALPRNAEKLYLNWKDTVELQMGDTIVVKPDYKGIIEEVVPAVMCIQNPLTCKGD